MMKAGSRARAGSDARAGSRARVAAVLAAALAMIGGAGAPAPAKADSCWWHNGSLMRLIARGDVRTFVYEAPRPGLAAVNVRPGTVLFEGVRTPDGRYEGVARRFSTCAHGPTNPYAVSGPVSPDQTQVTLYGVYDIYRDCVYRGRAEDELVFTYRSQC